MKLFNKETKKYINDFKTGTKIMFKEFFNKETNKKQRANMWSFMRLTSAIATIIPLIISIITGSMIPLLINGGIAGFGAITDYLDGKSARKNNTSSEYGKNLDQVADKFYAGIIGIGAAILNPLFIIPLILECVISAVNINYKMKYPELSSNSLKIGKIKEWPLMITLAFGFISNINMITQIISIALVSATTAFQLKTIQKYNHNRKSEKNILNLCTEKKESEIDDDSNTINYKKKVKSLKPSTNIKEINEYKNKQKLLDYLRETKKELINMQMNTNNVESIQKCKIKQKNTHI